MKWNKENLVKDILAGLTTSFAAIALGAAFGIQSGRGALAGMLAAAVIAIVTSILGGTKIQASGPTAPMTAVTVLVIGYAYTQFGEGTNNAEGFVTLVLLLTALIMILGGIFRAGGLIKRVPNVVILGFMNGIAVLIWWDQIKKLFGLGGTLQLSGNSVYNITLAATTFLIIMLFPYILSKFNIPQRLRPFIPGTLVTIVAMTYIFLLSSLDLQTVSLGGANINFANPREYFSKLIPSSELFTVPIILKAFTFAMQLAILGYLDSLLTSIVIDKMTGQTTAKNRELIAQGISNGVAGLVGGIPGAQATIRSVILVKEGAKTRLAGVMVGVFTLLGVFVFKDAITLVATAIFVGVLFKAGLDVFEKDYFIEYFKRAEYNNTQLNLQLILVLYTTVVTVLIDLNVAVITGTAIYYFLKWKIKLKDVGEGEETSMSIEA